jgi:hypothetical protein
MKWNQKATEFGNGEQYFLMRTPSRRIFKITKHIRSKIMELKRRKTSQC